MGGNPVHSQGDRERRGRWGIVKSNSTDWAEAGETCAITLKKNKLMQAVKIKLQLPNIDSIDFFKYKVFMMSNIKVYINETYP